MTEDSRAARAVTSAARALLAGRRARPLPEGPPSPPQAGQHERQGERLTEQAYRRAREQRQRARDGQAVEPGTVPMPVCWSEPRRTEPVRDGDAPDGVLDLLDPTDGRLVGALLVRLAPHEQLTENAAQRTGRVLGSLLSHDELRPFHEDRSYDALVDAQGRLVARRTFVNGGLPGTAGDEVRDASGALVATHVGGPPQEWRWADGTPAPHLPARHLQPRSADLTAREGKGLLLTRTQRWTGPDGRTWWTCGLTDAVDPDRRAHVQALRLLPNLGCLTVD